MSPTVTVKALTKKYDGFTLGPLNLTIRAGVTCVLGANGAGKSTLFKLLSGQERATDGTVESAGGHLASRLGYLPQSPLLPGRARAIDLLRYVAWIHGVRRADRDAAVARALDAVGLTDRRTSVIKRLSGGMQRRLAIAQTIVHDPAIILLDEPSVGLDPVQRATLREVVRTLARRRIVLLSTHLVEDARALSDQIVVLHDGQAAFDGTSGDLEQLADDAAPGDTALERAVSTLIASGE